MVYFLRAGTEKWGIDRGGEVLRVDFRAATRNCGEQIELRIHAVPAFARQPVEEALEDDLDAIVRWIRRAETSENVWRGSDHKLVAFWDVGVLDFDDSQPELEPHTCATPWSRAADRERTR
jgi:hypothetical protein